MVHVLDLWWFIDIIAWSISHRETGGTLGMVPIIINPIYTLYSGYLLGISLFKGLLGGFKQLGYHPRVPAFSLWISATCFSSNHLSCKTEDIAWIYRAFQGSDWHPGLGVNPRYTKIYIPPQKNEGMSPEKGPFQKEFHLPTIIFSGVMSDQLRFAWLIPRPAWSWFLLALEDPFTLW